MSYSCNASLVISYNDQLKRHASPAYYKVSAIKLLTFLKLRDLDGSLWFWTKRIRNKSSCEAVKRTCSTRMSTPSHQRPPTITVTTSLPLITTPFYHWTKGRALCEPFRLRIWGVRQLKACFGGFYETKPSLLSWLGDSPARYAR